MSGAEVFLSNADGGTEETGEFLERYVDERGVEMALVARKGKDGAREELTMPYGELQQHFAGHYARAIDKHEREFRMERIRGMEPLQVGQVVFYEDTGNFAVVTGIAGEGDQVLIYDLTNHDSTVVDREKLKLSFSESGKPVTADDLAKGESAFGAELASRIHDLDKKLLQELAAIRQKEKV